MYNPETYGWYQCDEEDYDSSMSLEEQAQAAQWKTYDQLVVEARAQDEAEETAAYTQAMREIAEMRSAVATVPSYCERYQSGCYSCGETNPAVLVQCSQCRKTVCLKHQVGAPQAPMCDACTEPLFRSENARFQRAMKIGGCHVE